MKIGAGAEVSMRSHMFELQRGLSNRTLRSAAATRLAKPGSLTGLRAYVGHCFMMVGKQLAEPHGDPPASTSTAVICAG